MWLVQKLREENNFEEVKRRFRDTLIIQFYLIFSIPFVLALSLHFQDNLVIRSFGENYGVVTILGIPAYLMYLSFRKDGVRNKFSIGFFAMSMTIMMSFVIFSHVSNILELLNIQEILTGYLSTGFSNPKIYNLVVDSVFAPIIVLWSIYCYRFFISVAGAWNSSLFKKAK